jgi:hypothetical protein
MGSGKAWVKGKYGQESAFRCRGEVWVKPDATASSSRHTYHREEAVQPQNEEADYEAMASPSSEAAPTEAAPSSEAEVEADAQPDPSPRAGKFHDIVKKEMLQGMLAQDHHDIFTMAQGHHISMQRP